MSLNCLSRQSLQRTDSDNGSGARPRRKVTDSGSLKLKRLILLKLDKAWSGPLSPSNKAIEKVKNAHPGRIKTSGALDIEHDGEDGGEPKLVRSPGLRRDWSFEKLDTRTCSQWPKN